MLILLDQVINIHCPILLAFPLFSFIIIGRVLLTKLQERPPKVADIKHGQVTGSLTESVKGIPKSKTCNKVSYLWAAKAGRQTGELQRVMLQEKAKARSKTYYLFIQGGKLGIFPWRRVTWLNFHLERSLWQNCRK